MIFEPGPKFVADRMLGKLARLLRMLGHDVAWRAEGSPDSIRELADREGRVLLTRDRDLARVIPDSVFIEYVYPFHQARQVARIFALDDTRAFTRCVEDNGLLSPVGIESVRDEVPPRILARAPTFFRCAVCRKVFWPGTHVERMRHTILELLDAPLPPDHHATLDPSGAALGRLEPLLDLHQAMDALFWAHRVALLRGEIDVSLRQLRRFAMSIARHLDLEEELVLPVYAAAPPADGFPRGGDPSIFRRDHDKILLELTALERSVEALMDWPDGEAKDLARIEVLDAERRYLDLLAHHDHRERAFLYPRLAEITSAAEQTELLERMVGLASSASSNDGSSFHDSLGADIVPPHV